jgi:hypothetical protein
MIHLPLLVLPLSFLDVPFLVWMECSIYYQEITKSVGNDLDYKQYNYCQASAARVKVVVA